MQVATWNELRDHLAATYAVATADDGIAVTVDSATVQVRPIAVLGAPWVELTGVVAQKMRFPPIPVLKRNFDLAVGNLASKQGELVLRQLLPLEQAPIAGVIETLKVIAASIVEARSAAP